MHQGVLNFILQYDSCGSHRAKSISACLSMKGVSFVKLLSKIQDLNRINNV